ncbi:MAG: class I SAM-dependent methyltransferase [Dehalococcoidia bacterium]
MRSGVLNCSGCGADYPIVRSIPRFVPMANYAANFGLEWNRHARTQYDSTSGVPLSERRFFGETGWPRRLDGELVLEAGSGSGRFTEQAAATGATVISLDYSAAVEANYRSNGDRTNVLIVQADIYRMPVRPDYVDRAFCFGVLQHTPAPREAFFSLVPHVKAGGAVVADTYVKSISKYNLGTKYWVRPLTRRVPPDRLYRGVRRYVDLMWPLASRIRRIPRFGPSINWRLLVADYSKVDVPEQLLKEWSYLDTFDALSPHYDEPQTLPAFRAWFVRAGLVDIEVYVGADVIVGRGRRPGRIAGGADTALRRALRSRQETTSRRASAVDAPPAASAPGRGRSV